MPYPNILSTWTLKTSSIIKFTTPQLFVFQKKKEKNSENVNPTLTKDYTWSTLKDKDLIKVPNLTTIRPFSPISRLDQWDPCHQINSQDNQECHLMEVEWWMINSDRTQLSEDNIIKETNSHSTDLIPNQAKIDKEAHKDKETSKTDPTNKDQWDNKDKCKTPHNKEEVKDKTWDKDRIHKYLNKTNKDHKVNNNKDKIPNKDKMHLNLLWITWKIT